MTETDFNINTRDISHMCRVCFTTESVRPMYADELLWYQNIVYNKPPIHSNEAKNTMRICVICGHIVCKYLRFASRCRDAHISLTWLQQDFKSDSLPQTNNIHNFITTHPKTDYYGPEIIDSGPIPYKSEDIDGTYEGDDIRNDDDDDDVPLVMIKDEQKKVKKKKKKKKRNGEAKDTTPSKPEVPGQQKFVGDNNPPGWAGFSSRMVRETDQYTVIKLTKEQVREELRSRASSPRYSRAPHRCERCVKGFNFEDVLNTHMKRHDPSYGSFECDLCGQFCPSAVSLRGHIKSHTTRYKCKVCGTVRLSRQHLLEHHGISHTGQPDTYICEQCPFTSDKRTVMQRHVATKHSLTPRLACDRCGRTFRTPGQRRAHMARHDVSRTLQCPSCPRRFIYASLLARHEHAVHTLRDYYCVECDHRFKSRDNLRLHFKKSKKHRDSSTYTEPARTDPASRVSPTFPCSDCDKVFTRKNLLTSHSRTHHAVLGVEQYTPNKPLPLEETQEMKLPTLRPVAVETNIID